MTRIINNMVMMVLFFLFAGAPSAVHSQEQGTADFFSIISDEAEGQGSYRCGASLIHEDIIITSMYCCSEGSIIRVGYQNDTTSMAIRTAMEVVTHPDADINQDNFPNDVAVVKLDASVTDITPIALNTNMVNPRTRNQTVYVAHAGAIPDVWPTFTIGEYHLAEEFSTEIQLPVLVTYSFRQCFQEYKSRRTSYKADPQKDIQFCALASPTEGPCDSAAWGGPMWDMVEGSPVLVGMVSQGACNPGSPPYLFTRIFAYVAWIQEQICALSDYPPDYCFEDEP